MAFNVPPPPSHEEITSPSWRIWFFRLLDYLALPVDLSSVTGILSPANGGTGTNLIPIDGKILVSTNTGVTLKDLVAGPNVSISQDGSSITINSTGGISGELLEPVAVENEILFGNDGDLVMSWGGGYAA
jgi:hypothetical protein